MYFKKLLVPFFFFIAFISSAQDSLQSKIQRWNSVLNYTPSIFYQEPGIAVNYNLSGFAIIEGRYNYLFKGFYYYYDGSLGWGNYWIARGNIYRISFKLKKQPEYRMKKIFEIRFTFKDILTSNYCWADGSDGLSLTRREIRSTAGKIFLVNLIYANRLLEKEKFSIDLFFSIGAGTGSETTKQHT